MCDKVLCEIKKKDDKPPEDYSSESASRISNRESLRDVEGYTYEETLLHWPPALSKWCPRASMYYAYTEDTNPFDRIDKFIENERKNFNDRHHQIHFDPPQDPFVIRDPYEENSARDKYLQTDPVCFVIFGKPGLDSEKLAKLISEWWKCILVSPESLIHEEISKNTDKGQWIFDSLKNDETLGPNVIINLIESRIKQRDVKHRGYVVEGLPFIPVNPDPDYFICSENISTECGTENLCKVDNCRVESKTVSLSNSEDSLKSIERPTSFSSLSLIPLQRTNIGISTRVNLLRRTTIQETLREVEDMKHARINPFTTESQTRIKSDKYEDYIPEQIENIFNSWSVKPTVIIYIACPDEDATERRDNFRFDPFIGKNIDTTESPFDDERLEKKLLQNVSEMASVNLRWELYKRYALPVIERHVLRHNPQNVIRVDGRNSISQMFEVISTKLRSLPLSRATIPKRIWAYDEMFDGEGDEDLNEEIEENSKGRITERIFQELARKSTISSKFRWTMSNWKFTCPVELAKGRTIDGSAEYAVRFMNKIFFLSSSEAMNIFLENPRPFLTSMRPKPSCKIAIFGPRYSGKTELSETLGRNFGGNVIDIDGLVKGMIEDRIEANVANAIRKARNRVIENLRIRLENERQNRENARLENLALWKDQATMIVREFNAIDRTNFSDDEVEYSEPPELTNIHEKLHECGLEFLIENIELAKQLSENETMIYNYVPDNLCNEEPPIRELSEHDPEVAAILENEVKHLRNAKIEATNGEIAGLLISRIKMMAGEPVDGELTREPGWIIDGMYPDPEIWMILTQAGVFFEDLILITEESPYKKLLFNWKRYNAVKMVSEDDENYEYEDEYIEYSNRIREMENYIGAILDFEEKWKNFSEILEKANNDPFVCNFDETSKVYEIVSQRINDRYRLEAKIITDEERETRYEDTIESITDIDEEQLEDEGLDESTSNQTEKDNRPLGDTGLYCPVALARNKVLRRGKDEYCASYLDKIYLCSSAEALNDFVRNPETFNIPFEKPMKIMPFPRICIVGPPGSGKSTLAKMLSNEYKMTHVDFYDCLKAYMSDRGIIPVDRNDQDRLEEMELPSDLTDKKYNDDKNTILGFLHKYEKEGASLPKKMLDKCFLNFFKPPYENCAVVFDSFPNCLEDIEIALENYAIPELVIELECSLEKAQERLLPQRLELLIKKRKAEKINERKAQKVEEEKEEEEYEDEEEEGEEEEEEETEETERDEEDEEEGREEEREVEEEEDWPDDEFLAEAREKILLEIEETYERTNQMLDKTRIRMEEESISWILLNGNEHTNSLLTDLQKIISPLISRNPSIFERTYELDPYKAEDLLECGYYLLSSFGRSCPVQMYEKKNPFQMFLPLDERNEIYPILHRHYVYFIAGEEASKKFAVDPLKYIIQDSCVPVIPAKISIIGPPKSGKSTLAERFARAYGMRVINREQALLWTRKNYKWTKTAYEIEELSRSGRKITKKLIARAIQLYASDYQSSTQGYILDGLPDNREETEELTLLNIRPMIVINLQADRNFCLTSPMITDDVIKQKSPENSPTSISQRYEKWRLISANFLEWLNKFSQNIVNVDATGSKWAVWRQTDSEVCAKFSDIKRYFREADYEKVHSLRNLCVTPYELQNRLGPHESYCPACLHYDEAMKFSGSPPDRRGVVQFREYFYWICPKHFHDFLRNPHVCLPPQSTASLPAKCPQILDEEIDIEHACWARRLVANGDCLVTYADSLPNYVVIPGKRNIGILYEDKLYLFCSLDCREKFLSRAPFYARIVIKWSDASTTMAIKNMPTLDFLEKTVADAIINSVTTVASERPKYPGISPAISAAIYIGIYLKIHNVDCALDEIDVYEEAERRFKALRRVPVPDARFDYLCEYFKPASKVPAFLNVVDIAGLVKGAAEGQGLGNAFLSHISACDAIFHLCRAFEDDDVTHIEGEVNPVRDLEIICEELRLKDMEFLGVHLEKLEKLVVRGNDKKLKPEYDTLLKVKNILHEEKRHIRFADWSVNEIEILNKYLFLTSKPVIYLVNLSEKDYIRKKNKWLIKIKEWVDKNDPGASLIPFSGAFENKVIDMDEAERSKYYEESKVTSALDKIIVQGYKALQLQYFFTSGADEVKAWTIQKGFKAPQAAGRIHTDFEKGFIMAEVMKFDDFKNEGSESGVKAAGKYRQQGRNYVVEDGDIIFFKFNAGAGLKDAKKK